MNKLLAKKLIVVILCLCMLTLIFVACKKDKNNEIGADVPRFDGMIISNYSPAGGASVAADDTTFGGTKGETNPASIIVPDDDMEQAEIPVDIEDIVLPTIEVDEQNNETLYYAEKNQDVYLSISLINPKSYAILRFTLNGVVYQSYQFESGSTSTLLILKVNSGDIAGIKDYTLDEVKYVDDADGNKIKDAYLGGKQTVKLSVAHDREPEVSIMSESMDFSSFGAMFYLNDPQSLLTFQADCSLYISDGSKIISTKALVKGENSFSLDGLQMGHTYQYMVVGKYDRKDKKGYDTHVIYKKDFTISQFCSITNLSTDYDSISFGYRCSNSIAKVTEFILFDKDGNPVQRLDVNAEDLTFKNLFAGTEYELRAYYTFNLAGKDYLFYDTVRTNTKAYSVPKVGVSFTVKETSIDFKVSADDDDGILKLKSIKLYDQMGEFLQAVDYNATSISNLSRNKNYMLSFTYSYDLRDGKGEQNGEKVVTFSTSKAVPVVTIEPDYCSLNEISFILLIDDPNVVGQIYSIRLYSATDGAYVNALTNTAERKFSNLSANTEYVVEVTYIYDMDDGNGSQRIPYKENISTCKHQPTFDIDIVAGEDSLTTSVNVDDKDNAGKLVSLTLKDSDDKVIATGKDGANVVTFDKLLSNKMYRVEGIYEYDLNNNVSDKKQIVVTKDIKTLAKTVPTVGVAFSNITTDSFDYSLSIFDRDNICVVDNVTLKLGETITKENLDTKNGALDKLYSNNKYTISVVYHYDLNDGSGVKNGVSNVNVSTLKKSDILLEYKDMRAYDTSIKFDFKKTDAENLMTITAIELYDKDGVLVQALTDLSERYFDNLQKESFYLLKTTYTYDLNDGKGLITDVATLQYGTSGSKIFVNSLEVLNNENPAVGDEVEVRLSLENPNNIKVTAIYISNVKCDVLNNTTDLSDVIVKFIPETDGGYYTVVVTGYEYESNGLRLTDELSSDYEEEILIMGELYIKNYFAITDIDGYEDCARTPLRIMEIYNPTGYEIKALSYRTSYWGANDESTTTNFIMVDDTHILISEWGFEDYYEYGQYSLIITGITFGMDGVERSMKINGLVSTIHQYDSVVHIQTVDDLENYLHSESTRNYYILDNDIDMKGISFTGFSGAGIFNGKGHTISNATIVVKNESTLDERYAFFNTFSGAIYDLNLKNIYYSITTHSNNTYVAGMACSKDKSSKLYNCSLSGKIHMDAPGGCATGLLESHNSYDKVVNSFTNNLIIEMVNGGESYLITNKVGYYSEYVFSNNTYNREWISSNDSKCIALDSYIEYNGNKSYYLCPEDKGGELGELYASLTDKKVSYNIVTNCDAIADQTLTANVLMSISVTRSGYIVDWYDNSELFGKPVSFPYVSDIDTTLYAKWTRITIADPMASYSENHNEYTGERYMYMNEYSKQQVLTKNNVFVIGGYYNNLPVKDVYLYGIIDKLFRDNEGNEISWEEQNNYIDNNNVTFYLTSTLKISNTSIRAKYVYIEGNNIGRLDRFGTVPLTLYVPAEYYDYYRGLYNDWEIQEGYFIIIPYNSDNNPFDGVIEYEPLDEANAKMKVYSISRDTILDDIKYVIDDKPYETYSDDKDVVWMICDGKTYAIVDNVAYANVEKVDADDMFKYIIYNNKDVEIIGLINKSNYCNDRHPYAVDLTTNKYNQDGYTIVSLADNLFSYTGLQSITLNEGLKTIGNYAFYETQITSITFPSTLKEVGAYAFSYCYQLSSVVMNDKITIINDGMFSYCHSLQNVVLSKNLREIKHDAFNNTFNNYQNFAWIVLPDTLYKIGNFAFNCCNAYIFVPSSVKSVGGYAFDDAKLMTSFVKKPSGWSIDWCNDKTQISWNIKAIVDNEDYIYFVNNKDEVTILRCKKDSISTLEFNFTEGPVVEIGQNAFNSCSNITEIVWPETIRKIGSCAFTTHNGLQFVLLPESVEEVSNAFCGNTAILFRGTKDSVKVDTNNCNAIYYNIKELKDTNDYTYIIDNDGSITIVKCKDATLTTLEFNFAEGNVVEIANNAFYNCSKISSIEWPETLKKIGDFAFNNCTRIKRVLLPSSLIELGASAFPYDTMIYCKGQNGSVSGANEYYSNRILYNIKDIITGTDFIFAADNDNKAYICGFTKKYTKTAVDFVLEGYNVVNIPNRLFESNYNITHIEIPASVETIGEYAFSSCGNVQSIVFKGNGLKRIEDYAFSYIYNLTSSIILPNGLEYIGNYAFNNAPSTYYIPSSIETIGWYTFSDTNNYTLLVEPTTDKEGWSSEWYNSSYNKNVVYGVTEYKQTTDYNYFVTANGIILEKCNNTTIKNAILDFAEGKVSVICKNAFNNCTALETIELPEGLITIGDNAFYNCNALKYVVIPTSVETIGNKAFYCNTAVALKTAYVPDGFDTNMDGKIYLDCTCVDENEDFIYIVNKSGEATIIGLTKDYTKSTLDLTISGVKVTKIGAYLFQNNNALINVDIPEGITEIGENAFYSCRCIKSVSLPSTLKTVGSNAFCDIGNNSYSSADDMMYVFIPNTVENMGYSAFAINNCYRLYETSSKPINWNDNPNDWNSEFVVWNVKEVHIGDATNRLSYAITNNNEAVLFGAYGSSCDTFELDLTYFENSGLHLTKILNYAFYNKCMFTNTNIIIPSTVTYIGSYAFCNASTNGKMNIYVPISVTEIGYDHSITIYTEYTIMPSKWAYDVWNNTIKGATLSDETDGIYVVYTPEGGTEQKVLFVSK